MGHCEGSVYELLHVVLLLHTNFHLFFSSFLSFPNSGDVNHWGEMEEWIPYNNFFTRLLLPYHQISLYKFSQKDKNQKVGLIIFDPTDSEIIFFNHKFSKKWQLASHIVACLANIWKKQWLFRGYELRWHVNCESVIGCERQVWGIPWRSRDSCGNWKWQNAFRLYIFFLIINIFFGFNFFFFCLL